MLGISSSSIILRAFLGHFTTSGYICASKKDNMNEKQQTLSAEFTITGHGLHLGKEATVIVKPAPENTGLIFSRTDLENTPQIPALSTFVESTFRGTTLKHKDATIATIEHLLSALYGMGVDNAFVEIDGPELPILDGSAYPFAEAIEKAGVVEQSAKREFIELNQPLSFKTQDNNSEFFIVPDDDFSLQVMVDYKDSYISHQYATLSHPESYKTEIAKSRTFVFLHELEMLHKNNLIKGGDLDNAIVIVGKKTTRQEIDHLAELFNKPTVDIIPEYGVLNNVDLYYPNETSRHKLLDLIGDLALLGKRIKGKVFATRPGHQANIEFITHLKKSIAGKMSFRVDLTKEPVMDINDIKKMLPHRPPFLLVDKIMEIGEDYIVGVKNITMNEPFFVGHFPEEPVMPGVLQIEAMAQTGGLLVLNGLDKNTQYSTYFMKIDNVKFKKKVIPGDTLIFHLKLNGPIRRGIVSMHGETFVNGQMAVEGDLVAMVTPIK